MTYSIDFSAKLETHLFHQNKEKLNMRAFKNENSCAKKAFLQEAMTAALKERVAKEKKSEAIQVEILMQPLFPIEAPSIQPSLPSWQPSEEMIQLFEKMASSLTYVEQNGIQTTTVTLKAFSSLFRDCTIEIIEYSTAPKVFNIVFGAATIEALQAFAPHAQQIQRLLQQDRLKFRIERLDAELLDPRESCEEGEEQ